LFQRGGRPDAHSIEHYLRMEQRWLLLPSSHQGEWIGAIGHSRPRTTRQAAELNESADRAVPLIDSSASLGQVGLDWQLGGFAASSPTGANGSFDDSTSQLVQAMAGFDSGGGAANGLNITQPAADTSQQTFLTTPHA
jgi:hypothetical protein